MSLFKNWRIVFLAACLSYFVLISLCSVFNTEDLYHMQAVTHKEAAHYISLSYCTWNARLGELATYAFGVLTDGEISYYLQNLYYILNPLMCIAAILLAYRVGVGAWPTFNRLSLTTLIFVSLGFIATKQDLFWFIGNMNWLYPSLLAMLYFLLMEKLIQGNPDIAVWKAIAGVPLAFVVGWSNDNTAFAACLTMTGALAWTAATNRGKTFPWKAVPALAAMLLGAYFFYTAPAAAARAETTHWSLSFDNLFFHSLLEPINWAYTAIFYWREFLVLSLILFIGKKLHVQLFDKRTIVLIGILFMLWAPLVAAPCWGAPRAYTPLDLMLAAILARLAYKLFADERTTAGYRRILLTARVMAALTIAVPGVALAVAQHNIHSQISHYAKQAQAKGEQVLILRKGDLDTAPAMPRLLHIPGCIMAYNRTPHIPLVTMKREEYHDGMDFHHETSYPYAKDFKSNGDDVLNKGVAKRYGLEGIIYLR